MLLLGTALTVACGFWVRQAEIVILASQITEAVPAIPAIGVLVFLAILAPLLKRLGKFFALTKAEIVAIYIFVAMAISFSGCGIIRFWIALLTAPHHFATAENKIATLFQYMPKWMYPQGEQVFHDLYLSNATGQVPWGAWAVPLLVWSGFFIVLWMTMLCLVSLVQRRWVEEERLAFPIVQLPLEIAGVREQFAGGRPFWRNHAMWIGFTIAAIYNIVNILAALYPSVPAFGKAFDLVPSSTPEPWSYWRSMVIQYRPELIGFGFLVSSEVSFSIWFFYVLSRAAAFLGGIAGYSEFGFPYNQEQSVGAMITLGMVLLWAVRKPLLNALSEFTRSGPSALWRRLPGDEGLLPMPLSVVGAPLGLCLLCVFGMAIGLSPWLAILCMGLVLITALVVARVRAEIGLPLIWSFPFSAGKRILLYSFNSSTILEGAPGAMTALAMLTFLSRGYVAALAGYQIDSGKITQEVNVRPRQMAGLILASVVVGLAVAFYFHLTAYYRYGGELLRGGIWGWDTAMAEYGRAVTAQSVHSPADPIRVAATGFGVFLAGALVWLRQTFVGMPLHPLGYFIGLSYGELIWSSFFFVWLIKSVLLHFGGVRLYRRAVPGFLGLALGHFFTAGVVWGLLGTSGGEAFTAYGVWFG